MNSTISFPNRHYSRVVLYTYMTFHYALCMCDLYRSKWCTEFKSFNKGTGPRNTIIVQNYRLQ